jgi:mannose-6-phosphate isomerase-like protein (cupin superfamily)
LTLAAVAAADRFVDLAGLLESSEVGDFRADFLSWGHHRPEYWRNYWYSHSFHEVCLAYAGSGRFNSGSVRYDVEPDSVFLARPGDVHEIESSRVDPLGSPSGASPSDLPQPRLIRMDRAGGRA